MMEWINIRDKLPRPCSIVEVKIKRGSCLCKGTEVLDCFFDGGIFLGVQTSYVLSWRRSILDGILEGMDRLEFVPRAYTKTIHEL